MDSTSEITRDINTEYYLFEHPCHSALASSASPFTRDEIGAPGLVGDNLDSVLGLPWAIILFYCIKTLDWQEEPRIFFWFNSVLSY